MNRKPKAVFVYGSRSPTFLSGTPYYFARALEELAREEKRFEVFDLAPRRVRELPFTFARWCLTYGTRRSALFLLSREYHDAGLRYLPARLGEKPCFIAFTQSVPRSLLEARARHGAQLVLYLDATFGDLFDTFDYAAHPPPKLRRALLQAERDTYAQVDQFAVFHPAVRDRLVSDYGIETTKIQVMGRGVNLEASLLQRRRTAVPTGGKSGRLRLMVVGRGPKRKGVFKLIDAIDQLSQDEQRQIILTVAGPALQELPERSYLRSLGFISAQRRDYLTQEMAEADLGVLLSEADSHPGSVWEFLSLGVPVWVSRLPHISEALAGFSAVIEDLPLNDESLVRQLRAFLHQPDQLIALRQTNSRPLADLTWAGPVRRIADYILQR